MARRLWGALGFKGKTPRVATLHLLFKRLDREKLEETLGEYFARRGLAPGEAIAICCSWRKRGSGTARLSSPWRRRSLGDWI